MKRLQHTQIEPGLLFLFRLVSIFWLVIFVPGLFFLAQTSPESIRPLEILSALNIALLLLYLYSNWLQSRLGWLYLPVALLFALTGAVLAQWLEMIWRIHRDVPPESVYIEEGYLAGALFVPLIIVSAQYNFRGTIVFTMGTIALQSAFSLSLVPFGGAPVSTIIGGVIGLAVLFPIVGFVVVKLVGGLKMARDALTERNIELARYASTVERLAISQERNRMARELHDTLAHTLSAVSVQLGAINKQLDTDIDGAKATIRESRQAIRDSLQETRRALKALRASPLEDLGFTLAMQRLVELARERSGLTITLDMAGGLDKLSAQIEQSVYRITEEALNNIARHAEATHIEVVLAQGENGIELSITDDGKGFDPDTVSSDEHYGLVGMRERALLAGGQLSIMSQPGAGTTVRLHIEETP